MGELREFEGRNVDQALYRASQELGRQPDELVFEVLERRPDRVRIRVEVSAAPGSHPPPQPSPRSQPPQPKRFSPPVPDPLRQARPGRERARRTQQEIDDEAEAPWSGPPRYGNLNEMVGALIAAGGLDLSVEIQPEGDTERVVIDGPDAVLLLENDAEALTALEHLLGKMALRGLGRRVRIRIDSAGYRKRREEELVQMALRSAERVKQEGGEFSTSPLNPYERRLVHMALKDDPAILTHSVGNGFLKRVTIRPRSAGES